MKPSFDKQLDREVEARQEELRPCEHEDCKEPTVGEHDDYCEEHMSYYYCECGRRLEDAAGSPGDGLCRGCD